MKGTVLAIAIATVALGSAGCRFGAPPPHPAGKGGTTDVHALTANTVFGNSSVTDLTLECAGRIALTQGVASIDDDCFSGDTNVVVCTDSTSPSPVMCAPHKGSLAVAGTGADTINYARIR
ncbi:MAG: hypothetical protein WA854_19060 [Candidatus Binataceae bacterium]